MRGWIAGFHPARVEAVGIALLLVGAVWEFTVMRQTAGEVARSSQLNIHRQLQYIFEEVASGNPKNTTMIISINSKNLRELQR